MEPLIIDCTECNGTESYDKTSSCPKCMGTGKRDLGWELQYYQSKYVSSKWNFRAAILATLIGVIIMAAIQISIFLFIVGASVALPVLYLLWIEKNDRENERDTIKREYHLHGVERSYVKIKPGERLFVGDDGEIVDIDPEDNEQPPSRLVQK